MIGLTPENVKVAIVMMLRAKCTGAESRNVARAIQAFEQLFENMAAAAQPAPENDTEDTNGDDAEAS